MIKLVFPIVSLILGVLMLVLAKDIKIVHWLLFVAILSFSIKLLINYFKTNN